MKALADFFLSIHNPNTTDYTEKFKSMLASETDENNDKVVENTVGKNNKNIDEIKYNSSGAPICPRCGATMVIRKATKGENAGNDFWGCSTFPKCRKILPI